MKDIKDLIKEKYTEVVTTDPQACCGPSCCSPDQLSDISDSYDKTEGYVAEADYALGCGIPTEFANIQVGNTVLDLGSGAGSDVFIARKEAGETGTVIGVDMTEAMHLKANENKAKLGYTNVEFRLGEIEALPVDNDSIDVVISNCVMNLVPDKIKAYSEVLRVLRSDGHFCISDVVITGTLPPKLKNAADLYVGCISGAMDHDEYLALIEEVGFKAITVAKKKQIELPDGDLLKYLSAEELKQYRETGAKMWSITFTGKK